MSELPVNGMIFSRQEHLAGLQRMKRIAQAKLVGYRFSKFFIVTLVSLSLIGAGTISAFAGNAHRPANIQRTVKASAGNRNHVGSSHSKASVTNNNSVHISGGGGSGGIIASGHRNNGNNHNNKKVVRKKIVRKVIKKNIDVSNTTNTTVNKIIKYYPNTPMTPSQPDYCSSECEQDYTPPSSYDYHPSYPSYPSYDHDKNPCDETCYDKNPCDQTCYRYPSRPLMILNNNTNTNKNYNVNAYHPMSDWSDDYADQ